MRLDRGLSIAPPGLDHFGWVTQGSQSLALGLTLIAASQLCFVITSGVRFDRGLSVAPSGLDHFGRVTQGSQSLALGLTLTAAKQFVEPCPRS